MSYYAQNLIIDLTQDFLYAAAGRCYQGDARHVGSGFERVMGYVHTTVQVIPFVNLSPESLALESFVGGCAMVYSRNQTGSLHLRQVTSLALDSVNGLASAMFAVASLTNFTGVWALVLFSLNTISASIFCFHAHRDLTALNWIPT